MKKNIILSFRRIQSKFVQFFRSAIDGSISILGASLMLLMVAAVAISIDSSRLVQASANLKSLNDMAAIAATKEPDLTIEERKAIYESLMQLSLKNNDKLSGFEYELSVSETEFLIVLNVKSRAQAGLFFPSTTGDGRYVSASSEVTIGKEHVEVALVLDISSSMTGGRLEQMQEAATTFIDILMTEATTADSISISIVPYGGTVKLPDDLQDMVNLPSTTEHWADGEWNGCLRMNTTDINGPILPDQTYEFLPDFYTWTKSNNWCPHDGNELIGLSNDADRLRETIADFTLSDGTGSDVGVAWGLATLDPQWRGELEGVDPRLPRDYNLSTKKIMVVMTDGGITRQNYPREVDFSGSLPYLTKTGDNTFNQSLAGFNEYCDLAKENDIEIFTVGLLLRNNNQINRLNACGTSDRHNFQSDLGDIVSVFNNLAESISALRLSR